jgi:hypothetical protein
MMSSRFSPGFTHPRQVARGAFATVIFSGCSRRLLLVDRVLSSNHKIQILILISRDVTVYRLELRAERLKTLR